MPKNDHLQPSKARPGERVLLLAIILAGMALRVYHLNAKGFWGDEIWTAQRSLWPPMQIISFSLDNTIGPWTYLAGWVSLALLGTDLHEFVLRWPSVIAGVMAIPIVWALGRRLWDGRTGLVAAVLVAASPYQVWYAQEARYYTWMVLFSVASTYFLYRAFEQPRQTTFWAGFSIATVLNIFNHPLSALLVAAGQLPFCLIYAFRMPERTARVAGLIGSTFAIALGSVPLVLRITAADQLNNQGVSTVLTPSFEGALEAFTHILRELVERFGAGGWSSWLSLILALLAIATLVWTKQHRHLVLLVSPFLLTPLFFALTKYMFILRYILFLQPLYLLLAARGVISLAAIGTWLAARLSTSSARSQGNARRLRTSVAPALAVATMLLLLLTSLATTAQGYKQAKVIDWRSMASYLERHAEPQDMIVARYVWASSALRWYFDPANHRHVFDKEQLDAAAILSGSKNVWLILPEAQPLDPGNEQDPMTQLDLTLIEDWKDSRFTHDIGYFPVSELPALLYVGRVDTDWIQFAEVQQPNWSDRSYSQIIPGNALDFSLTLPGDSARDLWVTYFDYPGQELQVSINGHVVGVIGGVGGDWQTAQFPVPDGLGHVVNVRIEAVGAEIGGVSHAALRPATR